MPMNSISRPHSRRGIPLVPLLIVYLVVALAPLALAAGLGLPPRSFRDELASGLAMVAFAMLLMEFVLSGRFRIVSGRTGIDLTMRFHQLIAWSLLAFLLAHPLIYQSPWPASRSALEPDSLGLTDASLGSGGVSLLLLAILVIVAAFRDQAGGSYERWRALHGVGAIAIAVLGAHHALDAGRYSAHPAMAAYWLAMVAIGLASLGFVHLFTPLRQLRHPYRVVSVRPAALRIWELTIEPADGRALDFSAGQFVWLTLNRSPFSITEHPFSMVSCPADRPRVAFAIKESGDFTSRIGTIPVGARAFVDGPHGNLTLTGREAPGIAFIAGGAGVAPLISILRQLRVENDSRQMVLLYGNRVQEQILYRSELAAISESIKLEVHHVLSEPPAGWQGEVGQLDASVVRRHFDSAERKRWLYFVCGPTPMIDIVERSLNQLGIPMRQIVSEKFRYD